MIVIKPKPFMVFTFDYVPNTLVMGVVAIDNHMAVPPIEIDVNVIEDILINGRLKVNVNFKGINLNWHPIIRLVWQTIL